MYRHPRNMLQPLVFIILLVVLSVIVESKKFSIRSGSNNNHYHRDDYSTFLRSTPTTNQQPEQEQQYNRRVASTTTTSSSEEYNNEYFTRTIETAAEGYIELVLKRNLNITGYTNVGYGNGPTTYYGPSLGQEGVEILRDENPNGNTNTNSNPNSDPNNDAYGTNNQEDNVEEGDIIVSDGTNGTFFYIYFRAKKRRRR